MSATYYIGAVEQTFARRLVKSPLFYASSVAFLTVLNDAAEQAIKTGVYTIAWKEVMGAAIGASVVTIIGDLLHKAQLAANAANPNVSTVVAVPKETK